MDDNVVFQEAIKKVLEDEGITSNDPHDPGGLTRYGISLKFIRENHLPIQLKDLTQDQAIALYKKYFWDKYDFKDLKSSAIAIKIFDTLINIGPQPAIKLAQRVITKFYPAFQVDGLMGEETINVLNHISSIFFLSNYRDYLVHYYHSLVINNPNLQCFLKGWLVRAES